MDKTLSQSQECDSALWTVTTIVPGMTKISSFAMPGISPADRDQSEFVDQAGGVTRQGAGQIIY